MIVCKTAGTDNFTLSKWYSQLYHFCEKVTGSARQGFALASLTQSGLPPIVHKGFTLDPLHPQPPQRGLVLSPRTKQKAQPLKAVEPSWESVVVLLFRQGQKFRYHSRCSFLMLTSSLDFMRSLRAAATSYTSARSKTYCFNYPHNPFPKRCSTSCLQGWGVRGFPPLCLKASECVKFGCTWMRLSRGKAQPRRRRATLDHLSTPVYSCKQKILSFWKVSFLLPARTGLGGAHERGQGAKPFVGSRGKALCG